MSDTVSDFIKICRICGVWVRLLNSLLQVFGIGTRLTQTAWVVSIILATHVDLRLAHAQNQAPSSCDASLIQSQAAQELFLRYQDGLRDAILPKLKQLNWNGKVYVSVQNLPTPDRWVAPHYMIRVDLENPQASPGSGTEPTQVILKNKTITTRLRFEARPQPDTGKCSLHLYADEGEYLVNQDQVPTVIFVPSLSLTQTLEPKRRINKIKSPARSRAR